MRLPAVADNVTGSFSDTALSVGARDMIPTIDGLFSFARSVQGQTLPTLHRKKPFKVEVNGTGLTFTPNASLQVRSESRDRIASLLERLSETGSFQPGVYSDILFNASYVLALVKEWQRLDT